MSEAADAYNARMDADQAAIDTARNQYSQTMNNLWNQELLLWDTTPPGTSPNLSAIEAQMTAADAAYQATCNTEQADADAAWNTYVSIEGPAWQAYLAAQQVADSTLESAMTADLNNGYASLDAASASWDSTEAGAYATLTNSLAVAANAWDGSEQSAWNGLQTTLAADESAYESTESLAWASFQGVEASATTAWQGTATVAWSVYQAALAGDQATWNTTTQTAWQTYQSQLSGDDTAWASTESLAWNTLQSQVAVADASWSSSEQVAWSTFQSGVSGANTGWNATESSAWGTYLASAAAPQSSQSPPPPQPRDPRAPDINNNPESGKPEASLPVKPVERRSEPQTPRASAPPSGGAFNRLDPRTGPPNTMDQEKAKDVIEQGADIKRRVRKPTFGEAQVVAEGARLKARMKKTQALQQRILEAQTVQSEADARKAVAEAEAAELRVKLLKRQLDQGK